MQWCSVVTVPNVVVASIKVFKSLEAIIFFLLKTIAVNLTTKNRKVKNSGGEKYLTANERKKKPAKKSR